MSNRSPTTRIVATGVALAALAGAPRAHAADEVARGRDSFLTHCSDCHSTRAGKNGKGPSLAGIVGRRAGTVPGYEYSDANRGSAITWTPEVLQKYLENPRGYLPGTKMKFKGVGDAGERAALVAFLGTLK
jgi:cytochrome c